MQMQRRCGVLGLILIGVVAATSEARQGPDWVCVNEKADWQARDSQGEFVYDDHLWVLGGWYTPKTPNPRDVWKSPDGKQWTCTAEVAPWEHSDLSVSLVFKNKMWFMGGRKLPGAENSNKVWSSTDGAKWTLETGDPGWCARVAPSFAVFRDRMWVLGGTENFYDHSDAMIKNDVWSSGDGRSGGWRPSTPPGRNGHMRRPSYLTTSCGSWAVGVGTRNTSRSTTCGARRTA